MEETPVERAKTVAELLAEAADRMQMAVTRVAESAVAAEYTRREAGVALDRLDEAHRSLEVASGEFQATLNQHGLSLPAITPLLPVGPK
jgi:uncharacterized protein involved in exopolysaccharide biosynthesis